MKGHVGLGAHVRRRPALEGRGWGHVQLGHSLMGDHVWTETTCLLNKYLNFVFWREIIVLSLFLYFYLII